MEKHVYFVRHGETDSNADNIHRGSNAMLNEKGMAQARAVAERIKRIGVEALISSPWPRARATADAIATACALPIEESDLFIERRRPSAHVGKPLHDPASVAAMKEIYEGYLLPDHRHSDEENLHDLRARANAALAFLHGHPMDRICVVTHGLFLRILFAAALDPAFTGRDLQAALDHLETHNTGITHFRYGTSWQHPDAPYWQVIQWNDSSHLG